MNETESPLQAACAVHPERQALRICTRCGAFACEQCLGGSPPGETLCAACVAREATSRLPWDYRQELGTFRAFFKSVGPIMLRPGETFAGARPSGDLGGALLFAGIANFFGYFTTLLLFTLFGAFMPEPPNATGSHIPFRVIMVGTYGFFTVAAPLLGLAGTVFIAAMDHLVLRVIGKPRTIETTVRAAAFSQAPLVIGLLPFCSLYIAPFWCLVAKVFAYKGMHRTTTGVAVGGAILAPVLLTVAFCGFYGLIFAFFAAAAGVAGK